MFRYDYVFAQKDDLYMEKINVHTQLAWLCQECTSVRIEPAADWTEIIDTMKHND